MGVTGVHTGVFQHRHVLVGPPAPPRSRGTEPVAEGGLSAEVAVYL